MDNHSSIGLKSDEDLALETAAGSDSSFNELIRRYTPRLFAFLRCRLASHQETEDLVQETFLKVTGYIDRYRRDWKFSTWIYTIASRLAISHFRALNTRQKHIPQIASIQMDPEDILIRNQKTQNLWNQARTLPPEHYRVLWLFYGEDMAIKEIADIMKRAPVTVRVLLHRARAGLGEKLERIRPQNSSASESIKPEGPAS